MSKSTFKPDITPQSHPDHFVVGFDFMGYSCLHDKTARYYCRSHDMAGYDMVNRADPEDDKNISERAIGRTYHRIHDDGDGQEYSQWGPCTIDEQGHDIVVLV